MNNRLTQALRGEINQKTADYVDAAVTDARNALYTEITILQKRVQHLEHCQREQEQLIAQLQNTPEEPDDKYALTRRKLIQLMKKLGIN